MKKGGGVISETFDEHERDTAQRAYPQEVVNETKLTAKINAFELDAALRGESGTRPAISDQKIEQHVRANIEDAFHSSIASAVQRISEPAQKNQKPAKVSATVDADADANAAVNADLDPHSRPTIDVIPKLQPAKLMTPPTPVMEMRVSPLPHHESGSVPISSPPPSSPSRNRSTSSTQPVLPRLKATAAVAAPLASPSPSPSRPISISRQMLAIAVAGVVLLILAAGTVGFYLGRSRL